LCSSKLSRRAWSRSSSETTRTFRSARTIFWEQLPPPSVGGLRPKGPVTWPFALPQPAPSRRPSAVLHGSGVARRRARTLARKTARSTDLQFVPRAHLLHRRRARLPQPPPSSPFGIRRGYPFAVIHGAHSGAPVSSARRPSARPASRLLRARLLNEVPGFGAVCSLVRLASLTVAPVLPRTSAGGPEPTARGEGAVALGACSRRTSGSP